MNTANKARISTFVRNNGNHIVVFAAGDIDMNAQRDLSEVLQQAFAARPTQITVDLTDVRSIDRHGVRCLLVAKEMADAAGIGFEVTGA